MTKEEVFIQKLTKEVTELKKQIEIWKKKYYMMEEAYQQLLNGNCNETRFFENRRSEDEDISKIDYGIVKSRRHEEVTLDLVEGDSPNKSPDSKEVDTAQCELQHQQQVDQSQGSSNSSKEGRNACQLIQGCFILQKIRTHRNEGALKYSFPAQRLAKHKNMLQITYSYAFPNNKFSLLEDDQLGSRRNEINFGTTFEEFQYVFDNTEDMQGNLMSKNQFEIQTSLMRRQYVYGVIRPEIIVVDGRLYETEMAYGFISSVPFPAFYKDLLVSVQQSTKLKLLNMIPEQPSNSIKIGLISEILMEMVVKSQANHLIIDSYPINIQFETDICSLNLHINDEKHFKQEYFNYAEGLLSKFSPLKLIKIMHYLLTEKHMVLICRSRKTLNQLLELIKILIYPLCWVFPVIYCYSPYFEPFLSSPLPLIIGFLDEEEEQYEDELQNCIKNMEKHLPKNSFVTIYAEDEEEQDFNELPAYKKRIKKFHKELSKFISAKKKEKKKEQDKSNDLIIYKYSQMVQKLIKLIQTGEIDEEKDEFINQFLQTQMGSYFRENSRAK